MSMVMEGMLRLEVPSGLRRNTRRRSGRPDRRRSSGGRSSCDEGAAENLGDIVHAPLHALGVIVGDLFGAVRSDGLGERDAQPPPLLPRFVPRLDLVGRDTGAGEQQRCGEVVPVRIADEVGQVQPVPGLARRKPVNSSLGWVRCWTTSQSEVSMVTRSGSTSNTERRSGAVKGVNTLRSRRVSTVSVCSVSAPAQPLAAQIGPPIDRCAVIVRAPAQRSRPPWASSTRD